MDELVYLKKLILSTYDSVVILSGEMGDLGVLVLVAQPLNQHQHLIGGELTQ